MERIEERARDGTNEQGRGEENGKDRGKGGEKHSDCSSPSIQSNTDVPMFQ
jgi:hypothetical protein